MKTCARHRLPTRETASTTARRRLRPSRRRRFATSSAASRRSRRAVARRRPRATASTISVAIGVTQACRVHQRDACGDRVPFVRRKARHRTLPLDADPPQTERREGDLEADRGSGDVPGDTRQKVLAGHGPHQSRPEGPVAPAQAKVVAQRDVSREKGGSSRIPELQAYANDKRASPRTASTRAARGVATRAARPASRERRARARSLEELRDHVAGRTGATTPGAITSGEGRGNSAAKSLATCSSARSVVAMSSGVRWLLSRSRAAESDNARSIG